MAFDLARSDALHLRVQRFITGDEDDFDAIACSIAEHVASSSPQVNRLFQRRGVDPSRLTLAAEIPAIPTDAFKLTRIAAHPPELDVAVFRTSGTTVGARGEHALRRTDTYALGALSFARDMLVPDLAKRAHVVALMPPPDEAPSSSLGFMCGLFAEHLAAASSFHLHGDTLDRDGIEASIACAHSENAPVLLLSTSFALVHLLDALGSRHLALPPMSRVMQTGGYKGKSREVDADELRALAAERFEIPLAHVSSEYGMTELSSQAYESALRASLLGESANRGVYATPRWMRITPVDPISLDPVPYGTSGIARIVDLANVDSAVCVQTQDVIEQVPSGFRLHGRLPGVTPRGCSLAIEELLGTS